MVDLTAAALRFRSVFAESMASLLPSRAQYGGNLDRANGGTLLHLQAPKLRYRLGLGGTAK